MLGALANFFKETFTAPTGQTRQEPDKKGFTISSPAGQDSGVTISTGGDGSFNIYRDSRDPSGSSSIATREARMNIARGGLPNIIASTNIEDRQEPDAAPTTVIPAGQTMTNLPPLKETTINPMGRVMPTTEQVRQQNILQDTFAPRPTLDYLTRRPIQYDDAYFMSGTTGGNPRFDANTLLNTIGIDRPLPPIPEGDVFSRKNLPDLNYLKQPNLSGFSNLQPAADSSEQDLQKVNQFITSKGFNPDNVVVFENKFYDRSSGALLELPDLTEILELED
jgi:hypothetical protein